MSEVSEVYEKAHETCNPRGEFKHRYWFFADTPNIARICRCIWKRFIMKFRFLSSSQISGRMYNTVVSIKCMMWKVFLSPTLLYAVICKQLLNLNDGNRVRWVLLGLSEDGACTDLSENISVNSLKGDLSNATTSNPPFFSLVNTFNFIVFIVR